MQLQHTLISSQSAALAPPLEGSRNSRAGAFRPYVFHLALAIYLPALLYVESRVGSAGRQHLLGLTTFAFLAAALCYSPASERRLVWTAVVIWTGLELFASLIWGIYEYRFGNVPLFVPFGHGLIYLFGLRAARTPLMRRWGHEACWAAWGVSGAWALAGLTMLPLLTGRFDFAGATLWPVLAVCLLASRAGSFYAAVFVAASVLELVGTGLGTWTWTSVQPVTHFPSGNPPSIVAGAYCLFDLALLRLFPLAQRAIRRRIEHGLPLRTPPD